MPVSGEITCTLVTTAGRLKCTNAWFEDLQATDPGGAIRVLVARVLSSTIQISQIVQPAPDGEVPCTTKIAPSVH